MCQHEKIEANPICNCDSNIAFIYYWWNAGTASSTAFRLVITNHSGYIDLRRCIDNRTSAEIFRQEVRCLGVSMLPFFNQKELVVCSNQSQYQKYTSLLEKAGIAYRTKARDLSSPSLFSMGTRERAGTAFQKGQLSNALYDICSQSRLRTCCSRYSCLIKYEHSIQLRLLFMVQCLCQIY